MNPKKLPLHGVEKNKQKIITVFVLFLISLIPIIFLLKPGFPITDDGTWLIIRFSAFFETFKSGQFPVRFIYRLNEGLGYPISNFLYPLYLYLATPIHILGFSFLNSIKILILINIFLTSLFSFLWLNKKFDNLSSFLGAVVVALSPYLLFDLFKRGSFGELLSISILPFILWQVERKSTFFTSLGIFLLILSHNTSSVFLLSLVVMYVILVKKPIKQFLISLIFGVGMAAFFWIPALYDLKYTNFNNTKISEFYNYLFTFNDYYLIGLSSLIIIVLASFFIIKYKVYKKDYFLLFSFLISLVIIFLQLPMSKNIWELFPLKNFVQFPFRILSISIFLISYQGAFVSNMLIKNKKYIFVGLLTVIIILQSLIFLTNIKFQLIDDGSYSTNQSTTTVADEYLTKWFNRSKISDSSQKLVILSGQGNIENIKLEPNLKGFKINSSTPVIIQANILYFPGWEVRANGVVKQIDYEENGLIRFKLDRGEENVQFIFKETRMRLVTDLISILSFTLLIFFAFKLNKKKPAA